MYPIVTSLCDGLLLREVYEEEWIQREGPLLLAGNHLSYLDIPIFALSVRRAITFLARKTLTDNKSLAWILNMNMDYHVVLIDRKKADSEAFKKMLKLFKQGRAIFMFPEGARSADGQLQPAKKGIGLLACRSQVPVVPTRIFGTYEILNYQRKVPDLRHPVRVVFGPPLMPAVYDSGKQDPQRYEKAAQCIMNAIAALELPFHRSI